MDELNIPDLPAAPFSVDGLFKGGTTLAEERVLLERSKTMSVITDKVTIVGAGQVGMACAFAIVSQGFSHHLALVDMYEDKVKGEAWDLEHASAFMRGGLKIEASSSYDITHSSSVCVVTAGARQREGESRLDLLQRNVQIFKNVIPKLVEESPDTVLLIVSNPVDILTWVAWKISGLPKERVIGSGTNLDSSRLRTFMSQRLGVAAVNCHGYIIGEHGDSSVAVWSSMTACGVRLRDLNPKAGMEDDPENWEDLHQRVINGAYDVIKAKGYTSWAIGMSVSWIVRNLLRNERVTHVLSVHAQNLHGIKEDMYLALPAIAGPTGVQKIISLQLTPEEEAQLQKSASTLWEVAKELKM
ncbi:unnamed protein product [Vitrella brassicaformis CCMP3155]|uniref:L-lactate dehydrogenase n=1 Tax=Vitrella brassicaformis (strain CCMP3155) TaxID=1169540 RepID=A0A0G4G2T7_VITBC|nr:unnamed protein product [Vitrella brassicaformis CCMP3155]|eukprot:CEM22579.1 unnamed protein product [Vitrella brassicaformis CCMP3155]